MGLDLKKMKEKLAKKTNRKNNFFKLNKGEKYILRLVPLPDGDYFKHIRLHYNVGEFGFICPSTPGNPCPACKFAKQMYNLETEEGKEIGSRICAKDRNYSLVLVRGGEQEELKWWSYGKEVAARLKELTFLEDDETGEIVDFNRDGDLTDEHEGHDLKVWLENENKAKYPSTKVKVIPNKSPLAKTDEDIKALLKSAPELDLMTKTFEEIAELLDNKMLGNDDKETEKYGAAQKQEVVVEKSEEEIDVDKEFASLTGEDK